MNQGHLGNDPQSKSNITTIISSVMNHKTALLHTELDETAQQKIKLRVYKAQALQA